MEYNFNIEEITKQVREVIHSSQGFNTDALQVEDIVKDWFEAKKEFIHNMNGNLIYQTKEIVSFHLDDEARRERLYRFADVVLLRYHNESLSDFLYRLNISDFYNNKTSQIYYATPDRNIPPNYKVIKSFKFFEKDSKILKDLQNEASRIIQEDTVNGYLCLSVHPLDFLSASENAHNWRSCHALDGEYRSGNLNYLMDSSTVICYLKSPEENAILPHFPQDLPWNSKKWRVWLYFSNDRSMLFAGKQYPFSNDLGIEYIKDKILPNINFGQWGEVFDAHTRSLKDNKAGKVFYFEENLYPIAKTLKPLKSIIKNGKNTHMYNDLLSSHNYSPMYSFKKNFGLVWVPDTGYTNDRTIFNIGQACRCPICNNFQIDRGDIMACQSCIDKYELEEYDDNYTVCDICGVSYVDDDMTNLYFSDYHVCPSCLRNETNQCQFCGIEDIPEIIKYHNGVYLCPDCIATQEFLKEDN